MSKLSFRARALDPSKPMPIYLAEDLPDLPEYSAINRAVPQMPSGMEKEEESEHHLQRAICTGLIIPTPEVFQVETESYNRNYPSSYKIPRQLIHMQPLGLEQDIPDYDMDSGDEIWVNSQSRRLDLTPLKFEQMMDRLEKSSGQTVVTLNEAKALLKQDDEVSIAVYDYWLNKRLKTQHPLILSVKTENRSGLAANNPYLAFRRRTEKMQTRKNRKNDETSYEKMLKLRRDLSRAVSLLEMVKRREKTKREQLHLSIEIFEKRYQARDFSGSLLSELSSTVKSSRPAFAPLYTNQYSHHSSLTHSGLMSSSSSHHYSTSQYLNSSGIATGAVVAPAKRDLDSGSRKEKRQYKKRKHKLQREKQFQTQSSSPAAVESTVSSDEEDVNGNHLCGSEGEDEGLYAFRRNKNCDYHRPLTKGFGNWPWESKEENGIADPRFRFTLASLRHPRTRCIGFTRRRIGRGGRVILDRISTNTDDIWSQLDYTIFDSRMPASSAKTNSGENDNISRDTTYLSSSTDFISNSSGTCNNINNSNRNKTSAPLIIRNTYNNSNSNSCIEENSINKSSSYLINQDIVKREQVDCNNEDWMQNRVVNHPQMTQQQHQDIHRLDNASAATPSTPVTHAAAAVAAATTAATDSQSSVVIDLVRTHVKTSDFNNRNSTNNPINISNNNNINNSINNSAEYVNTSTSNSRTILNNSNDIVVIKREKEEMETDYNNILDDENVDLARLSSIINATKVFSEKVIKTELVEVETWDLNGQVSNKNYLNNLVRLDNNGLSNSINSISQRKSQLAIHQMINSNSNKFNNRDESTRIDDALLEDVRKNWLHFRPKTPEENINDSIENQNQIKSCQFNTAVAFTEQTKIAIEMQRLGSSPPSSVFTERSDPIFLTSSFAYNELGADEQLMCYTSDGSNSGTDLNVSGDSLNELNLSLGEEDSEKMLDNILQECQIDEVKALNQTTNFWNGLLEDGSLLDVIEEKKLNVDAKDQTAFDPEFLVNGCGSSDEKEIKRNIKKISNNIQLGYSSFTIGNVSTDEKFFKNEEDKNDTIQTIKIEPPEEILAPTVSDSIRNVVTSSNMNTNTDMTKINVSSQNININSAVSIGSNSTAILSNLNLAGSPKITKTEPLQVPIQTNQNQQNTMISLGNVKLEKVISGSGLVSHTSSILGTDLNSIGGNNNNMINSSTTPQTSSLVVTQKPTQQSHIVVQQITTQSPTQQILNAATTGFSVNDSSGTIVLASGTPTNKRQINGPSDKNAIQNILKQTKLLNRKIHISQQGTMQTIKQDDDNLVNTIGNSKNTANQQQHQQQQQHQHQQLHQQTGNYIKMSSYPIVGSDLSVQTQNALSASAVAVASNHNYSLQPSAQPITIIGQNQQGSKIILNSTGSGGTATASNFAIATPIQDLQNQIHYNQVPTSNIKVNLVTSAGLQGSLVVDPKNSDAVAAAASQQSIQNNQSAQQRLKVEKTLNMYLDPEQKRVLYTKVVNLAVQKNNSGQTQTLQVTPSNAAHILNKTRPVQRHAIMRSIPVTNQVVASSAGTNSTIIASGSEISLKQQNNNSNDTLTAATTVSGINLNTTNR